MRRGARFLLPSGRVVEVLGGHRDDGGVVVQCGYVDRGRLRGQGAFKEQRLSLRESWLLRHGRPTV